MQNKQNTYERVAAREPIFNIRQETQRSVVYLCTYTNSFYFEQSVPEGHLLL